MFLLVCYSTDVCWILNVKSSKDRFEMDMRYWIPAGAVSPNIEKETDFLTDETQRTQKAALRYWTLAGVASHSQEQEMRADLAVDETGSPNMTCKEKNEGNKRKGKAWAYSKKHKQLFITVITIFETSPNTVR